MTSHIKEYQDVYQVATRALDKIDPILEELKSSKTWSWFDFLGDNIFYSWVKRRKMKRSQQMILDLQKDLNQLEKELADIDQYQDLSQIMNFSRSRLLFDLWLDNPLTDYQVHKEIKKALKHSKPYAKT